MYMTAHISKCGDYRYSLSRTWDASKPSVVFVMLNPSTADHRTDDPTIRRCIGFAKRLGAGSLYVFNLFARRSKSPKDMMLYLDPVGPLNHDQFACLGECGGLEGQLVICAWGTHGAFKDQDLEVMKLLDGLGVIPYCLGVTKDGHPKHPLYLPADAELVPYLGRK